MNRFLKMVPRMLKRLTVGLIACCGFPIVAWAQGAAVAPSRGKGYINQYAIVIFLIAMGLIIVCMPSRRADEPAFKREFLPRL